MFWLPALLVLAADRLTKLAVQHRMVVGESHRVLGEFFRITSVRNSGAVFGMFPGNPLLFLWISVLAILLVLGLYARGGRGHRLRALALGLILGGALGNLHDRIFYRQVVDFLDFTFGRYHFPVFNVADSAVTVGVALLALDAWIHSGAPRGEAPDAAPPPGDAGS